MASCSDETIRLFDVKKGEELPSLKGHSEDAASVVFSPDGQVMASGSDDETVRLWNASTSEELRTFKGCVDLFVSMSFSPDGKSLAFSDSDNTIRLYDVNTGNKLQTLESYRVKTAGTMMLISHQWSSPQLAAI